VDADWRGSHSDLGNRHDIYGAPQSLSGEGNWAWASYQAP
jgi:hypothetical protein